MGYPASLMWGGGYPVVTLTPPRPTESRARSVRSTRPVKVITLPHVSVDGNPVFMRARADGGAVKVSLKNGIEVYRGTGYRVRITLIWPYLTDDDAQDLAKIFNHVNWGSILLQPHNDVPLKYYVTPEGQFAPGHTGELCIGHSLTVTFTGTEMLSEIPTHSSDHGYHPLIM